MGKSFLFNSRLCVTPTVASRAETDTSIESIEQLVSNYANSWADVMYDGNVFPQNYIKVVNSSNEIVAYEVSFCDRFTLEPMGYVVLSTDLSLENPVIEYTLDGNDIYSQQSVNNPSELSGVNCAPTALTNLVFYYDSLPEINGLIYNNPLWTYSRICSLAGFDGTRGLYNDEMIDALEEYVNERNFNISIDDYWKD